MSRITDIAKTMKTWWNEDDDPFVHRALDEIIRIDQEQLPTIEPKYGEWIFKPLFPNDESEFPMGHLECSVCGSHHSNSMPCNYCDNCGVRMKGADDEIYS